jgi:N-acylmannosamine kinase
VTRAIKTAVVAIDIGGTKIAGAIVQGSQLIDYIKIETPRTGRGDDLVEAIGQSFGHLTRDGIPVAVATTGIVVDGALTALNPTTLPIEDNYPLVGRLERRLGCRTIAINDAQAATWGEFCFGAGRGVRNFAFITVSTGVGGGLVIGEKLLTGPNGLAGHLGHMTVSLSKAICGCGRVGCLESVASGTAIGRQAKAMWGSQSGAPEVFERAAQGDSDAEEILSNAAQAVAESIANLAAAFDVDRIALGGGVGLAGSFLERVLGFVALQPKKFQREVIKAETGDKAGLFGVANLYEVFFRQKDFI